MSCPRPTVREPPRPRPTASPRSGEGTGTVEAKRRSRSRRGSPRPPPRDELGREHGDEREHDRDADQPHGGVVVADLVSMKDRESHRLGPPGDVTRDENRGAELPEGPTEREKCPGKDSAPGQGKRDATEHAERAA